MPEVECPHGKAATLFLLALVGVVLMSTLKGAFLDDRDRAAPDAHLPLSGSECTSIKNPRPTPPSTRTTDLGSRSNDAKACSSGRDTQWRESQICRERWWTPSERSSGRRGTKAVDIGQMWGSSSTTSVLPASACIIRSPLSFLLCELSAEAFVN